MTTDRSQGTPDLEAHFAAARDAAPRPSLDLMARLEADALDAQAALAAPRVPARRRGAWAELRQALGGWPGLAGLATAGCAGLWLGLSPGLDLGDGTLWSVADGSEILALDPSSGFDFVLGEG